MPAAARPAQHIDFATYPIGRYREWLTVTETVAGARFSLATKPGVFSNGRVDPAAQLLAQHAVVKDGAVVVHLNCGNGLFGAVAAARASHVYLTDRHVVSQAAAVRTLAQNGITNATALLGHGTFVLPPGTRADVVGIRIPHEKQALLQLLHDAFLTLKVGGRCYMAGANNEGIKPAARTMQDIFGNALKLAEGSSHRVIVATKRAEQPTEADVFSNPFLEGDAFMELPATLRGLPFTLYSRPGVFSWDHVDEATDILATTMVVNAGESVLDLGCGCGALGVVAGTLSQTGTVRMVDADVEAVRSTRGTIETAGRANCSVVVSDVAGAVLTEKFDVVVSNPPFHVGKATDLSLPLQFIRDAHHVLVPGGRLYLVANRTLPYEAIIAQQFGHVETLHDGARFKVLHARRS
jgi:16S rRNA (guanine1207-N2)-methyltransferase